MNQPTCELCGEPMPKGEEMFKYHGYSGPCPKPPLAEVLYPCGCKASPGSPKHCPEHGGMSKDPQPHRAGSAMKVSWPHTDEYATLYESAEWQDKLAGPRSLVSAGIVFVVFWGVVFWLLGAWGKLGRYF